MNKVMLVGRLTKAPELKKTTNGKSAARFSLAINRTYTEQDGERKADFPECVCYGTTADNLYKYMRKGSQIGVEGKIRTYNYENNKGERIYKTEVTVDHIEFLESKKVDDLEKQADDYFSDVDSSISDDELPF